MFLKTEDLTKTYQTKGKEAIDALKNVSLSFPHNGLVFLLGESGCGKSTLLSILGGLAKPTSGDVFFFGESLSSMSEDEITAYRNFDNGFILQENVFIDDLDVSRNVMLGLKENEENVSAASESLKTVGLSGFDSRRINELSGGQKQRVAIARALVKKCSMMLCDEPTAALDEDTAARIFSLLKTLSSDHLIIVACHDRDAAFRYGDRIIEMNDGSIIRDLTAAPSGGGIVYSGDRVFIPKEHSMTTDEFAELANRLKKNEVTKIFAGPKTRSFIPTERKGIDLKEEADKKRPNLFSAFSTPKRLWLSSLAKRKKRYALSVAVLGLACTMFGSALVCSSYDVRRANIDTLLHASADVIAIRKEETFDDGSISYTKRGQLSKADVETLSSYFDLPIMGVGAKQKTSFINYRIGQISSSDDYTIVPLGNGVGIAEANRAFFESSNFKFVAGAYPENDESMVISTEIANFFRKYGYKDFVSESPKLTLEPGFEYEALIGKPLKVNDVELTISGIVKFTTDYSRYKGLQNSDEWSAASYFGRYLDEYERCVEDDFAWNIYLTDPKSLGVDSYEKAVMTIPRNATAIGRIYDSFDENNANRLTGFTMSNPHLKITNFIVMNMDVFSGFFWVFGGLFATIAILIIIHLQLTIMASEKRRIGLYRTMGASKASVISIYLPQAIILSFASALLGIVFLFAMPAIVNAIIANEFIYVGALLSTQFWHVLVLLGIPLFIAIASLALALMPSLGKEPFILLKSDQ